jgi:Zn-dependent protease
MTATRWIIYLAVALPSIILHEIAHGYVAYRCGDPTAKNSGRLTLNPLKHIDPFGTLILPIFLVIAGLPAIGYAKPVPVSINRLRDPRNQSVYVSLAGPLTNVVLVGVAWAYCRILVDFNYGLNSYIFLAGIYFGLVNIFLFVFNMIPIPPLDGSAVVERLVPRKHLRRYFQIRAQALPYALIIMFGIIYLGFGNGVMNSLVTWWFQLIT